VNIFTPRAGVAIPNSTAKPDFAAAAAKVNANPPMPEDEH
jgi:hypothetical protein